MKYVARGNKNTILMGTIDIAKETKKDNVDPEVANIRSPQTIPS
jgi:hypothetical protein